MSADPKTAANPHAPIQDDASYAAYVEDFRRAAHSAVDWAANYLMSVRQYPVVSENQPGDLTDALPPSAPDAAQPYDEILRDFQKTIMPAVTHWNHPRFFAYFATSSPAPSILAEMLSATLNTNGLHWKTSPAVAELEKVTLAWLRQWIGLPENWFGIIYDTASVSSLHAIAAAREMVDPEAHTRGTRGDLVLYASDQSHSSIDKAAITLGIGQSNIRKIPSDSNFRLIPGELEKAIQQDIAAGKRPFCVVATVGTTSSTSIDPVPAMADIAERYSVWLHVDAAYAGPAAILPECHYLMDGVERAHSLVLNPHKWMFVTVDLSVLYTSRPDILRQAFSLVPEYLRTAEHPRAINLMDYGVPLGRRFRPLKLWFVMRYFGREGIQRMLRAHIQWAQEFAAMVERDSRFERVAPAPLSVVCFRYKGSDDDNRRIVEQVNESGKAYISHTVLNGKVVVRMAIGNIGTTREDVKAAWELIQQAAPANV